MRFFLACLILLSTVLLALACNKNSNNTYNEKELLGKWVLKNDQPGKQPADTITFFYSQGKYLVSFDCSGSPAPGPDYAETEFKFHSGKLSYKDYLDANAGFVNVDSFEWVIKNSEFSIRFYQLLQYISADYRVTYQKI